MQNESTIDRTELRIEAARWGGADFCVGKRLNECPYLDQELAHVWAKAYGWRKARASRFERFIAGIARILRTKIF